MFLKDIKVEEETFPVIVRHSDHPNELYEWNGRNLYEVYSDGEVSAESAPFESCMLSDKWEIAPTSPKDFERHMKKLARNKDTEASHNNMDGLMCDVLKQLGYGKGVEVFQKAKKHYA